MVTEETEAEITRNYPCRECGKGEIPVTGEPALFEGRFGDTYAKLAAVCDDCAAAEAKAEAEAAQRAAWNEFILRRGDSNLPRNTWEKGFDTLQVDEYNHEGIEQAKRWGAGEVKALVLAGPVGTGKTATAIAATLAFLWRRRVRFATFSSLSMAARAGFKSERRAETFALLLDPTMPLVLDDIDKTQPTDYTIDLLFQVIDERYSHDTPLLVTTNLNYEELKSDYGEPIASRIAGYCLPVRMEGPDRRQR